jgi:hypothetical protein
MTAGTAAVILAHNNPQHVRRLIGALDGLEIFLHCDSKTPDSVLSAMISGAQNVELVPRFRTVRSSWAAVEAELAGLRMVLDRSAAEHIVVLSGSCYPLVTVSDLQDELSSWRGLSRLELKPIPYRGWSFRLGQPDGGRWRFDRRFLTVRGRTILARGYPIPTGRRAIPDVLRLHASSQWKIYARAHAETLLRVLDERPDLVRFWRSTFAPEESCPASILASPELTGSVADELRHDATWYIDWRGSEAGGHPRWLELEDFPRLLDVRNQPPLHPDDPRSRGETARKLFARKIGPVSADLLDRIDAQLRV